MRVEPARDAGHHRREDRGRASAHEEPEDELERDGAMSLGTPAARLIASMIAPPGQLRADRTDREGCPSRCCRTPWRESRWSWRSTRRSLTSRCPEQSAAAGRAVKTSIRSRRSPKGRPPRQSPIGSAIGHSVPYQLVGISVKSHWGSGDGDRGPLFGPVKQLCNCQSPRPEMPAKAASKDAQEAHND